jgi:hypothetical protein
MINYNLIHDSISFYEGKGFKRIESPWTITKSIAGITKPSSAKDWTIEEKNKVLVASGEQSFLYLYNKGFLPKGKFQTVTPCFRDEAFTPYNTKYFIKNELIVTDDTSLTELNRVILCARDFFRKYCLLPKQNDAYVSSLPDDVLIMDTVNGKNVIVEAVEVNSLYHFPQYDLVYRGIELGSYGVRKCGFLTWIYGTGVAEPRLSRIMEKHGIPH